MKTQSLKTRILLSFLGIIFILGVSIGVLGFYQIKNQVIKRAQAQVSNDLRFAHSVYSGEIEKIKNIFKLVGLTKSPEELKAIAGLDYVFVINRQDLSGVKSGIAKDAFDNGRDIGGARIIDKPELRQLGSGLYEKSEIEIKPTPKARPTDRKILDKALVLEYAMPYSRENGKVVSVIYGGKITNRDFRLVDKIRDAVFEDRLYGGRPVGTVTIFLDDTRITTNVLDNAGNRAIGTRVSSKVYENVVEKGKVWLGRAFVVTDWYLTSYEPIKDISGHIIGILYVGLLERPFIDILRNTFLVFLAILVVCGLLAVFFSIMLAEAVSRPLLGVLAAAEKISGGDLEYRAKTSIPITELNQFAESFNRMADKLNERDKSLKISNEKLANLNKSYLDLIGFVSHELKGILSSVILNAYSVRDGFLGLVNFKQRKALDLVTRNLDYLASTVKNFLSLSRIEKGELTLNKQDVLLKEDVFDVSINEFTKPAAERGIQIINNIPPDTKVSADADLLLIAANNLIGNAVKYAKPDGRIIVSSWQFDGKLKIEVYNDGVPITGDKKEKLFKRFFRLDSPETKKVQGTGLGLFITKEIIEKHNGRIWVEPKEAGNSFILEIGEKR